MMRWAALALGLFALCVPASAATEADRQDCAADKDPDKELKDFSSYVFGNVPIVREHFTLVVLGIVFVSILPGVFEYMRHRRDAARRAPGL